MKDRVNDSDDDHEKHDADRKKQDEGAGLPDELSGLFGPIGGAGLDAEMAALEAGPPWQPVAFGEGPELVAAYRQARALAERLRARLVGAGFMSEEFPGLCGSVDAAGRPIVVLGAVRAATAKRLGVVLRGSPIPPARGHKDEAA